jgi:hypothetical protein
MCQGTERIERTIMTKSGKECFRAARSKRKNLRHPKVRKYLQRMMMSHNQRPFGSILGSDTIHIRPRHMQS